MINSVVFKVGKGEYRGFLEALQEATGRAWEDFPRVRKELRADLKQEERELRADLKRERSEAVEVWLDQYAWVAGTMLWPGRYQMVILEEEENRGTVYFFWGRRVNVKKIDGLLPVEIVREPSEVEEPVVVLEEKSGYGLIRTIHLPDRTFRSLLSEEEP